MLQEFAAAAPQGATAADVREKAERFVGRPDVLRTASGELTTRDLVECEQRLITAAVGRAAEKGGFVDAAVVDRVIAASARPLNGDQAMVVRAVAGDGRGVDVVEALAGTGKTYTAAVIREVYAAAAYEVIGVAPTGRAARELGDQAGIAARTLDRLLIDLDELGDTLPDKCVIVLDEAGMAPTRQTARLLEAAAHAGAKVVAIGDSGQLASVRAGGWLRAVGARLGALRLTEVMRQRAPAERRALAALHDRRPRPYLDWATTADRIETHADATAARQQAIREWADATADVGPAEAVMIARENAPRDALNRAARELLRDQGALGEERAYGAVDVAVGDRVICRRNDRWIDVDNGTRGTVRHLADERIVIETDSHLVRDLPAGYVAEHVEHAYALTGHGMQGATVERAFVVASPRDLTAGWSYTALSRARATTRLLIHPDQPDLKRVDVAPIGNGSPATDDLLARVRRQMTVRDDEDLAIEQLEPAGRADDPRLTAAGVGGPTQEQGAAAAEPAVADTAPERLAALRSRIEQLTAQRDALPIAELHRVDELDARISACTQRQAACAEALAELPAPRWRLGRRTDPYIVDRVRHRSMLAGVTDQLEQLTPERARLVRELGAPDQVRSELEGLNRAIRTLMRERRSLGDEVAQREHGLDLATGRDRDTGVEIGGI
ncbi:MAG: ATP-dependent DNA helicase [Solirubrobacteraceae bacterium]